MGHQGAGLVVQRGSQRPAMAIPLSWHCLGPRDMSLVAKRFRHVAVAIPEVRVSRVITASLRQESPQPQQKISRITTPSSAGAAANSSIAASASATS